MKLSGFFNRILKPISSKGNQSRQRTLIFGSLATLASVIVSISDFSRHLPISSALGGVLSCFFALFVLLDYKEINLNIKTAFLVTFNVFTILKCFAEGLASGGYMLFFVAIVIIAFLMEEDGKHDRNAKLYIAITILSFLTCIFFCPQISVYQAISTGVLHQMFVFNAVVTVVFLSIFTYLGINMEKQVRLALLQEKEKAETNQAKVVVQNNHLKDIAFMSAHSVRAPLTNIMSIAQLINVDAIQSERDKLLITHLKSSAAELDSVVHDIVDKTSSIEV